jgi:hypothetical protein
MFWTYWHLLITARAVVNRSRSIASTDYDSKYWNDKRDTPGQTN